MKRTWRVLIGAMLMAALVLGGCKTKIKTQAPILVMGNDRYMVLLNGTEPVTVSLEKGMWPEDLTSGDMVEITWDGMVMESYPGQAHIDKCLKVAEGDLADLDQELLLHLSAMGWKAVE